MFILFFIVIFGPKKGVLTTYASFWNFKYFNFNQILINFLNNKSSSLLNFYFLYRFQFTIVTRRTTIYLLFSFWLFFFFFGESLLLILFNFSTVTDSIYSNYFFIFKHHTIFSLNAFPQFLSNTIMFYIIFFTVSAFIFLLNLRYTFNYYYLNNIWMFDLFFILTIFYLFFNFYLFIIVFLFLIYNFYKIKIIN